MRLATVLSLFAVAGAVLSLHHATETSQLPSEDEETEVGQGQVACPTLLSW